MTYILYLISFEININGNKPVEGRKKTQLWIDQTTSQITDHRQLIDMTQEQGIIQHILPHQELKQLVG
jgi:hypothetical protein